MAFGYTGKILRVNLSTGQTSVDTPDEKWYRTYFGGRGLIAYYLLKEVGGDVDPLGPDNKLIMAAGPVAGAPIAGSGRSSFGAKSPLTGAYGDGEGGGYVGAELKRAGWDAVIIEGKAAAPVYLYIKDDSVEIRDAAHLWGKTTGDVETMIREELSDKRIRTAQCGIAGQNLVKFSGICQDLVHFCGRSGMGTVMGSKNLCCVAVRATKNLPVADVEGLRAQMKWLNENFQALLGGRFEYGTTSIVMQLNGTGGLPTRNFREGTFEGAESISGQKMNQDYLVDRETCWACPARCKRVVKIDEPYKVDPIYGGPEYETLAAFGSCCGVSDLAAVCKCNELCAAYSLDTISTGVVVAFAMECYENGIITKEDAGGLELNFGNGAAAVALVEMIARREGIGDILADGVKRASERLGKGSEQFAMQIKGQELPMHEPRLKAGLGLGYMVSPTGADHCHNFHDPGFTKEAGLTDQRAIGILNPMPDSSIDAEKVRAVMYVSLWRHFANCVEYCQFLPWDYNRTVDIVRATTGWNTSLFELMNVARRAVTLTRIFNLRQGFTEKDDRLPERMFIPFTSGATAGRQLSHEDYEEAKLMYYGMMGWDEHGVPKRSTLEELGVGWATEYIPAKGIRVAN